MTNTSPSFYKTLGPFLARRHIAKEVGGPIWDDDGKQWWAALIGGEVAGFAAARDDERHVTFQSAYVLPEHRKQGIYRTLFYARMEAFEGCTIRAVCTAASLPLFLGNSFTVARQRGSFTEVTHAS
jgi:predicted GNAT family acetyltransferase